MGASGRLRLSSVALHSDSQGLALEHSVTIPVFHPAWIEVKFCHYEEDTIRMVVCIPYVYIYICTYVRKYSTHLGRYHMCWLHTYFRHTYDISKPVPTYLCWSTSFRCMIYAHTGMLWHRYVIHMSQRQLPGFRKLSLN